MTATLHYRDRPGPMLTVSAEVKQTPVRYRGVPLSGGRIPTTYMVKINGRWRRVYAAHYGGLPTMYVGPRGAWLCTVQVWQ